MSTYTFFCKETLLSAQYSCPLFSPKILVLVSHNLSLIFSLWKILLFSNKHWNSLTEAFLGVLSGLFNSQSLKSDKRPRLASLNSAILIKKYKHFHCPLFWYSSVLGRVYCPLFCKKFSVLSLIGCPLLKKTCRRRCCRLMYCHYMTDLCKNM